MTKKDDVTLHLKKRQLAMLQALRLHKGLITYACKAAGISRQAHYDWMHGCEAYKQAVNEIDDFVLDHIENAAMKMIDTGNNPAVLIFYLKTKGKKRGFVEKQQIEVSAGDMSNIRNLIKDCESAENVREY